MARRQDDIIDIIIGRRKVRIGDLLVEHEFITREQLNQALDEQQKTGKKVGETLIDLGLIKEQDFLELLSTQLELPLVDLSNFNFRPELVRLLPETHARHLRSIVLKEVNHTYLVGMVDPTDLFAIDELSRILKRAISPALVNETDMFQAFDIIYRSSDELSAIVQKLGQGKSAEEKSVKEVGENDISGDPAVKVLKTIFEDAVRTNASDIHIEPGKNELRIRMRIDGILQEQVMNEKKISESLISRLKQMSNLDISEKRLPQDGRFILKTGDRTFAVRLSTMPIQYGESVVMRLLDQSRAMLNIDDLGMPEHIKNRFCSLIKRPDGMVLITGPAGSGKTTTLYSALSVLNSPTHKIITVEDPIEYRLPRINQIQINPGINFTFTRALGASLHLDPDIIMVSEMHDKESIEIGLRAAITGHFVLSTLHTNDSISSVNRLIDMGAEGYLVASALRAVLAQRLIRRNCEKCSMPYEPAEHERTWLYEKLGIQPDKTNFRKGTGCHACNHTGFKDRIGVFELLEIDDDLADALRRNDTSEFARKARTRKNFRNISLCAIDYALEGVTTIDEVSRISEGL